MFTTLTRQYTANRLEGCALRQKMMEDSRNMSSTGNIGGPDWDAR